MLKTARVDVRFVGERNFPVASAHIPPTMVYDFEDLMVQAQAAFPTYTYEQLFRFIWVRGLDALRVAVRSGTVPDPNRTPIPRTRTLSSLTEPT